MARARGCPPRLNGAARTPVHTRITATGIGRPGAGRRAMVRESAPAPSAPSAAGPPREALLVATAVRRTTAPATHRRTGAAETDPPHRIRRPRSGPANRSRPSPTAPAAPRTVRAAPDRRGPPDHLRAPSRGARDRTTGGGPPAAAGTTWS
ncbi:hypothetical protein TPA0909_02880 [Streptomyces albus]|nr:hypothetical protein TPA0909_02880 [Streptomyces albus]